MNKNTHQADFELDTKLGRKCFWVWIALQILALIVWIFHRDLIFISQYVKGFFPSIDKLESTGTQAIAAVYFSISVLISPLFLTFFAWKENSLKRFQATRTRTNRTIGETAGFILLGFPLLLGILAAFYFAPFELSGSPRLSGQLALHFMINTELGLVLLGPLCTLALMSIALIIYFLLSIPFFILLKFIKE